MVIRVNHESEVVIHYGLVKAGDMPTESTTTNGESEANDTAVESPAESKALTADLQRIKLQALQCHLLNDETLAADLLHFSIACSVLTPYQPTTVAARLTLINAQSTGVIDNTIAAERLKAAKETLPLGWLTKETHIEKFTAYRALSNAQKKKIMTYCTAVSFGEMDNINSLVAENIGFSVGDYWQPTPENYFNRVTTKRLLEIGKTEISEVWADQHKKFNKSGLVTALSQHNAMAKWLPDSMR